MKLGIIRGFKLDQPMIESPTFHLVDDLLHLLSQQCLPAVVYSLYLLSTSQRGCSKKEST